MITNHGISQMNTERALRSNAPCRIKTREGSYFQFKTEDKDLGWYSVENQPNICSLDISADDINNQVANCSKNNKLIYENGLVENIYINDHPTNRRCEVQFGKEPSEKTMSEYMKKQVSFGKVTECKQAFREVAQLTEETSDLKNKLSDSLKIEQDARRVIEEKDNMIRSLQAKKDELKKQKSELQTKVDDKKHEIDEANNTMKDIQSQLDNLKILNNSTMGMYESQLIAEKTKSLKIQADSVEALKRQNEADQKALADQMLAKNEEIAKYNDSTSKAQKEINNATNKLANAVASQLTLRDELQKKNTLIVELTPSPQPRPLDPVVLCQHCDYQGYSIAIRESGKYNLTALRRLGFQNDDISSIKVPHGWKVTIFEHDNFSGKYLVLNTDNKCLVTNGFNDVLSSMIVERI